MVVSGFKMGQKNEIKSVITFIRNYRNNWRISKRGKNLASMTTLGIDLDEILNEIYLNINWQDYVSGPEEDNHDPKIPGNIWIFGMKIEDIECYLKFQIKDNNIIFWISVHPAQYELHYPFR